MQREVLLKGVARNHLQIYTSYNTSMAFGVGVPGSFHVPTVCFAPSPSLAAKTPLWPFLLLQDCAGASDLLCRKHRSLMRRQFGSLRLV